MLSSITAYILDMIRVTNQKHKPTGYMFAVHIESAILFIEIIALVQIKN
jgi:hypothetical protein